MQQQSAQDTQPVGGGLVLRLGPVVAYDAGWVQLGTSLLAWLQTGRLRLFNDARPDPECVLDVEVASYDLDLTRMPRDRTVTVVTPDAVVVRLVAQAGSCACQGGTMLRGWGPSP